jgi:iron(III) transport system substrate-binding protein
MNKSKLPIIFVLFAAVLIPPVLPAGGSREKEERGITLYSGRGESLVKPLIAEFTAETGIRVAVRYGGTSELAVLLQEEGRRTPADVFWAQDAGALGSLSAAGLLTELPEDLLRGLPEGYKSGSGHWVATSGRARVLALSILRVRRDEVPRSVFDLVRPEYRGRVGWSPVNGSFQSFVTALRASHGEAAALAWVKGMTAGGAKSYRNNNALVEAIAAGEIDMALTNHYYLLRFLADDPNYPVRQVFFEPGDIGNLVNVAGVGVSRTSSRREPALEFVRFLLGRRAQQYFTAEVFEYPVRSDIDRSPLIESHESLLSASPRINLEVLQDLAGTLELLRSGGAL